MKIFGIGWHTAHQYELCKLPDTEFYYIKNNIKPIWNTSSRPLPNNLHVVDHYEPGKYDLAILHIDQQCLFGHIKGIPYKMLNKQIQDIPKIVINHGTPHYQNHSVESIVARMQEAIGDNIMLVNSFEAQKEWGFGEVIHHGLDPEEWRDHPHKENRIITTLNPGTTDIKNDGWAEYYNREVFQKVKKELDIVHIGSDIKFDNFDDYKNFIGRSLIYFNPTRHSPMPRSRTEAMLSGCCVVTTSFHDADRFIVDGQNGFICDSKDEMIQRLLWLRCNPTEAARIGQEGKKTAIERFHKDRYQKEWQALIQKAMDHQYIPYQLNHLNTFWKDLNTRMTAKYGKNWAK